jgi:hypothetical protein
MKTMLRALLIGSVVAFGASTAVFAGDAADPVVGTWKLNLEKSKFNPGPAVKSQTRVYTQGKDGITVKADGVGADGSAMSQHCTYKYDGKDYPFAGAPLFDSIALKQVDAHTVTSTQKKAGKVVGTTERKLSADGKVLTLESKGTNANGAAFDDVMVFDKQ